MRVALHMGGTAYGRFLDAAVAKTLGVDRPTQREFPKYPPQVCGVYTT